MIPFDEAVEATLRGLGLAEPLLMMDLTREWAQVAGEPWATRARPLYLRHRVLVVEAGDRGGVAFLRYGVAELQRRLTVRFGPDAVQQVEVKPPGGPRQGAW